jgi:hypothetical protein
MSTALIMIASTTPDPPINLVLLFSNKTDIQIGWSLSYDGGANVDDYEVDWKLSTSTEWTFQTLSTAGL